MESFQLEAMMNSTAVNFHACLLVQMCLHFCWSKLLDYKICEISVLISATSLGVVICFTLLPAMNSNYSTCVSTFVICLFHFIHSGTCATDTALVVYICNSLMTMTLSLFILFIGHLYILFNEVLFWYFCIKWTIFLLISLYFLDMNPLWVFRTVNIFTISLA